MSLEHPSTFAAGPRSSTQETPPTLVQVDSTVARCVVDSPIGRLMLTASARGLTQLDLVDPASDGTVCEDNLAAERSQIEHAHLRRAERALERYFAGSAEAFNELTLAADGTAFQRSVWDALRTIPAGTAISYRALAERIGKPKAVRAVGLANGRNPLPIIVPCHRVIGADRRLTGFGLGIAVKAWLLVHEGAAAPFPEPVTAATRVSAADARGTATFDWR